MERKEGLERLTAEHLVSKSNQHYIVTHFIVNDIKENIQKFAKGKLLDVGCGNKPYKEMVMSAVNEYIGCDVIQSSQKVVDVVCPANQLAFESGTFDTVFSTQVIEHVADHQGMVSESYRVLKPGGYAIYTAPCSWELHEEPYDFFRFTKYGLKEIFEKNGFQVVQIKANGGKWAAIFQLWINVLYSTRKYKTMRSSIIKLLFISKISLLESELYVANT